jgi:tRNA(Ile)-lysidine synthase
MPVLEFEIKRILQEHQLIDPESSVIVAVSGGPDSMALLHILAFLRRQIQCIPIAVYVDHGLRPDETPEEIKTVQKSADALELACEIIPVNTRSLVQTKKISVEHAARELRYQALRTCAFKYGATRIAVAHTADDQVEELLLRLLRGSGRKGLSGMRLQRDEIIRPLLATPKKIILNYLEKHKICFCHDSSNDEQLFLRNRIRHTLLPLLEQKFDPGIRRALLKTAANLSEDESYLEIQTKNLWQQVMTQKVRKGGEEIQVLSRTDFTACHPCLQRRLAERLLWTLGTPARYQHIMAIIQAASNGRSGSELHLSKGLRVEITRHNLEFSYPRGKKAWRGRLQGTKGE